MDKKTIAIMLFEHGFNCAQSVFAVFCEDLGFSREKALMIGSGFGGGMGRMGLTCGAVTGAFMTLGLVFGTKERDIRKLKEKTSIAVKEFSKLFTGQHGSIQCMELLRCDLSSPEGLERARREKLFSTVCPKYVGTAVTLVEQLLRDPAFGKGNS